MVRNYEVSAKDYHHKTLRIVTTIRVTSEAPVYQMSYLIRQQNSTIIYAL